MKTRIAAVAALIIFLRWLAVGHVTVTAGGVPFAVPALAVAAVIVLALVAAAVALLVYQRRAERAALTLWHARKAATS